MADADISLQAALNGGREHPAVPRTPEELATEARAAVDAGAESLHLHPYDERDHQTLAAEPCAVTLRAVRDACPGIPISLSTSADIEPDSKRRHEFVAAWTVLPDLVTANMGEAGILELCELLVERGIGIEAGLLSLDDARIFVESGIASRCVRAMVEPLDSDPDDAVSHAKAIERTLIEGGRPARADPPRRWYRLLGGQSARCGTRPRHPHWSGRHTRSTRRACGFGKR